VWQGEAADLALLQIANGRRDVWWARLIDEAPTVLAIPGTDPIYDVSAIGFPDATLAIDANRPDPNQPTGTLLPSSGIPGRIGFDVSTSVPDDHPLWQGLSGAAIRDAVSGRLFAIVTQALPDRAARRLYASPLPNPDTDPGWAAALRQVGAEPVLEDRYAPQARQFLTCYDLAGRPWRVGQVPLLGDFGVRRARDDLAPNDQPYFPFVGRPEADSVEAALNTALTNADAPRIVLLVGESAVGKSRLAAEVVTRMPALSEHRFIRPAPTQLIGDLPEVFRRGRVLLWLDDLHRYLASDLDAQLARVLLTNAQLVIVATLLLEWLRAPDQSDFKTGATDLLTDDRLIARIDVAGTPNWSIGGEADSTGASVARAVLAAADHAGVGLGEYLAAYAELRNRYRNAGPWARALINCVADWSRTGMSIALPEPLARDLWQAHYLSAVHARQWEAKTDPDRISMYLNALQEATQPALGSTALLELTRSGLSPNEVALLERQPVAVPDEMWAAAVPIAAGNAVLAENVALQAALAQQLQIVERLRTPPIDQEPRALFSLRQIQRRYRRAARTRPEDIVPTARSIIGDVVGRDELCRVMIASVRDPGTRRPHVVVGGSGTGKTALLVRLTTLLAQQRAVPVAIRLRDAQERLDFGDLARERFIADLQTGILSDNEGEKIWRQLLKEGRIVVLADGLEEALVEGDAEAERDNLIRLAIQKANLNKLPLIITSRPHDPLRATDAALVELEPLSEEAALDYIQQGDLPDDEPRIDWIVETAEVAEAPLYLQVARQLHRAGLLTYPTATRDEQQLDTRNVDRSELRLRLLEAWKEALVNGYFLPWVALSRDDRIATIELLSVLACTGLRQDRPQERLPVDLKDYLDLREWRSDDGQVQPIIREVRDRLGRAGHNPLDVRLAVTWGTQLGLVEAHGNAVRFPDSILQAYLGSRLIGFAMKDDGFRAEALKNAGRELLIALVLHSRAMAKKSGLRGRADTVIDGGGPANEPTDLRTLLRGAAGWRSDAKALNLYATALEIDSVAAVPEHQAIADEIAKLWQMPMERYPRTLEDAKLNLVRRFGESARAMSERHGRDGGLAKPAYRQLFGIGCAESSYPVRLVVAQEIGAGGDDALAQLAELLGPDPANGGRAPATAGGQARVLAGHQGDAEGGGAGAGPGHEDDKAAAQREILQAWLVPLLVGSATSAESRETARGLLQCWLDSVHAQHRQTNRDRSSLSREIALAQGFKYAANRRRGHPHAPGEARAYLAEQTQEMLHECDFWFTRLTLLHALTLWHLPDGTAQQSGVEQNPDYKTLIAHWCRTEDRRRDRFKEHPFVAEGMRLCVRALETGQPERYLWIDENGIVSTVGSSPASPGRRRKHNLWIPPSTGWTALNARAQQLIADVLLLLNLAERGEGTSGGRDLRLQRTNRNNLPPCIAEDRAPLEPNRPLGTAGESAPGSTCTAGCQFYLCPYPQKGAQPHRQELSEAFCRRQQTILSPGTLRSRAAPWQEMSERRLKGFWKQMEQRALSVLTSTSMAAYERRPDGLP